MRTYSLSHVSDPDLLRDLASLVAQDRTTTADLLAHIAEVDARKLYLPAAHPSMVMYCVHELHLSEDSALKRIRAARTARRFPVIFEALADGRLNVSAVLLLTSYLTRENAEGLLASASYKTRAEIEQLLAERFPRSEVLPLVQRLPASSPRQDEQVAPGPPAGLVEEAHASARASTDEVAPGPLAELAGEARSHAASATPSRDAQAHVSGFRSEVAARPVEAITPRQKVAPIARERFLLQFTIGQSAYDLLQYARELLSHQIPSGDVAEVFERALKALIPTLEKTKFAATSRPRSSQRPSTSKRHIPDHVKRAVWARDQGQCTFVSETGRRCLSRKFLEYDHIDEVARGGMATVERMRLRCRAHNQYTAERTFGADFMENKRQVARRIAEARRDHRGALSG
jgi:hypothetical protein